MTGIDYTKAYVDGANNVLNQMIDLWNNSIDCHMEYLVFIRMFKVKLLEIGHEIEKINSK